MTQALTDLITTARALTEWKVTWRMDGARPCPIGWHDCSQPVFTSTCGRYTDHGEREGPGDVYCHTQCPHGHQPPEIE